jgi:hypothetical protein
MPNQNTAIRLERKGATAETYAVAEHLRGDLRPIARRAFERYADTIVRQWLRGEADMPTLCHRFSLRRGELEQLLRGQLKGMANAA